MIYDLAIIGSGVAGTFATLRLSQESDKKIIVFDMSRPPGKRRPQMIGYLGCLPSSDGKFYLHDVEKVSQICGVRKSKSALTQVQNIFNEIADFSLTNDNNVSVSVEKRIKKLNYQMHLNDYFQIYPSDIHNLSKYISGKVELNDDISFSFDNEVKEITKQKNIFTITSEEQEIKCKKILLTVGRSGWRWAKEVYSKFGIIESNDISQFGVRVEMNSGLMRDFNESNCTILKNNEWELGPISWYGTVIPEDHVDMAIAAFRSNESRWKTDKVSFSLIGNKEFSNTGFEQTDRLAQLTFILSNERISKERISSILTGKSKISIMKEYDWLKPTFEELELLIPDITNKAYFHTPAIIPMIPKIKVSKDFSTEVNGLYVAGESAGITGLMSAALSGYISAGELLK